MSSLLERAYKVLPKDIPVNYRAVINRDIKPRIDDLQRLKCKDLLTKLKILNEFEFIPWYIPKFEIQHEYEIDVFSIIVIHRLENLYNFYIINNKIPQIFKDLWNNNLLLPKEKYYEYDYTLSTYIIHNQDLELIDKYYHPTSRYPLTTASQNGYLKVIKHLVEQRRVDGLNGALVWASQYGQLEIVKYLVEKGADDYTGSLWQAIEYGQFEVVKYLLEQNNSKLPFGYLRNYIIRASLHGYLDIVEYLSEKK